MSQVRALQDAPYAPLAQLVEQRTLNPKVVGSNPPRRTIYTSGGTGIRAALRTQYLKRLASSSLASCTILQGGRAVMQQLHKLPYGLYDSLLH